MQVAKRIAAVAGVLVLALVLGLFALARKGRAELAPLLRHEAPEAPSIALPDSPGSLAELLAIVAPYGHDLDGMAELRDSLKPEPGPTGEPPAGSLDAWRPLADELDALAAWTRHGGVRFPPAPRWDAPEEATPFPVPIQNDARALTLRAWQALGDGRPEDAVADLQVALTAGVILEHGGGMALPAMVGVSAQAIVLGQIDGMLAHPERWTEPALKRLADHLAALRDLPTGLPPAIVGECEAANPIYQDLTSQAGGDALPELPAAARLVGYDADATIAMARAACQAQIDWMIQEPWQRGAFEAQSYWTGGFQPVEFLTNPIGRILVDISAAPWPPMDDRLQRVRTSRRAAEILIAVRRARLAGEDPQAAEELVPRWLSAVPRDPWRDGPLVWNGPAEQVESAGTTRKHEPLVWGLDGRSPNRPAKKKTRPLPADAG